MPNLNVAVIISGNNQLSGPAEAAVQSLNRIERTAQRLGPPLLAFGSAMTAAGAAAFALGSEFDSAFDTIRVGTGATGQALEALQEDFRAVVRDVPTDFATAAAAIAELHRRTGQTGEGLQDLATRVLELSRLTGTDASQNVALVTRVFGDWGIATDEQADALDRLFRASQATGVGVDELSRQIVQFGAPLRQMGFSFEESAALLGKFEREGVNAELVLGSLRIALTRFARDGVDARTGLLQTIDAIERAGSASEANAIALEVFGARAGPDMAAAIREGRSELGDLLTTIESGDETILKAAADTSDAAERMQLAMNRIKLAAEPAGAAVFEFGADMAESLLPVVETGAELLGGLARAFDALPDEARTTILGTAAAATALSLAIGATTTAMGPLISVTRSVIARFGEKKAAKVALQRANKELATSIDATAASAGGLAGKLKGLVGTAGLIGLIAGGAYVAGSGLKSLTQDMRDSEHFADKLKVALIDGLAGPGIGGMAALQERLEEFPEEWDKFKRDLADAGVVVEGFNDTVDDQAAAVQNAVAATAAWDDSLRDTTPALSDASLAMLDAASATDQFVGAVDALTDQLGDLQKQSSEAGRNLDVLERAVDDGRLSIEEAGAAILFLEQQQRQAEEQIADTTLALVRQQAAASSLAQTIGTMPAFPAFAPDTVAADPLRPRAHGGPVEAGRMFLVGERGPELFVPRTSGAIVPNSALRQAGEGGTTINVVIADGAIRVTGDGDRGMARRLGSAIVDVARAFVEAEAQAGTPARRSAPGAF